MIFTLLGCAAAQVEPTASPAADAEERMSRPPASASLPECPCSTPLDMSFGKPAVEVTINGRGPFKLLIDTGASPVLILNAGLAAELELPRSGTGRVGDPTDPEALEVALHPIDSFSISGATFSDFTAISWDRSSLYTGDDAPRGVIGFPLFRDVLATFDHPGSELRIASGKLEPGDHVVAYTAPLGVPEIPILIDGKRYEAHLDSGSRGAFLLPLTMQYAVVTTSPPKEVGRARTVNSEFAVYSAEFDGTVEIAGHPIKTPTLNFVEILDKPNVGSQVLRDFAMTFDQRTKLARFDLAAGTSAQVERPRRGLGIRIGRSGSDYIVAGTEPDTPAATADLREGDRVIAVNGKEASDLSPADFGTEKRSPVVVLTLDRDGKRLEVTLRRAGW